jgi:uncharacterized protein
MIPAISESAFTLEFLRKDGFSLEAPFGWGVQIARQEQPWAVLHQLLGIGKQRRALDTLPLNRADVVAIGRRSDYFQDVLASDDESPRCDVVDNSHRVSEITVPVSSIGGWYDIFLPGQLRDFLALQAAGRSTRLTIGPWPHISFGIGAVTVRELLDFGLAHAPRRFHLQAGGALSHDPPSESDPDRYRYDPAHPTPAVGGVRMAIGVKSGRVDNASLEARSDVLTYTSARLDHDLEAIGEVRAEIWFRSSLPFADVFVRLCDVNPRGRSYNVCDGLISLTHATEITCANVRLWPTAHRFKRGHSIRVQVSSGAFPRYNRNTGTGENRATATTLSAADQKVFHDRAHPSAVILPVK